MNFEEWYNVPGYRNCNRIDAEFAWEACKQEILKILKDKNNHSWYDTQGNDGEAIDLSIIEEIEKL